MKRDLEFPRVGNKSLDFIILLRQDRASFAFRAFSCLEINICKSSLLIKGLYVNAGHASIFNASTTVRIIRPTRIMREKG